MNILLTCVFALLFLGCSTSKSTYDSIVNKYWKLITLDGKSVNIIENQDREQYFILKRDQTFNGYSGCNQFGGKYRLKEGNKITFSDDIMMTKRVTPYTYKKKGRHLQYLKPFTSCHTELN